MTKEKLITILWDELDKYCKASYGIEYDLNYSSYLTKEDVEFRLLYKYRGETIPYGQTIPRFWYEMDEAFVRKNFQIMVRNVIKSSFSVEIERMFGWKDGGFNPL